MNVFSLLERASKRLQTSDVLYHEQANTILGILRSSEVIPYKRSSINGRLHKLFACMLLEAYDADTSVDVATTRAGTFHRYGFSTKIVSYMDKMVANDLLISQTGKAKGKLVLSDLLDTYLSEPMLTQA